MICDPSESSGISYAAYLFHPVIDLSQIPHYYGYPIEIRRSASMVMDFMATILLATLSWRLLERPVRNWVISKSYAQRGAIVHSRGRLSGSQIPKP